MEIVLLLILTGLLSVIMFFSLKKLIESLNKDSQKYYFKTMQALDKKIEEKNKETNEEKINNEFYEEDKKKVEVKAEEDRKDRGGKSEATGAGHRKLPRQNRTPHRKLFAHGRSFPDFFAAATCTR